MRRQLLTRKQRLAEVGWWRLLRQQGRHHRRAVVAVVAAVVAVRAVAPKVARRAAAAALAALRQPVLLERPLPRAGVALRPMSALLCLLLSLR